MCVCRSRRFGYTCTHALYESGQDESAEFANIYAQVSLSQMSYDLYFSGILKLFGALGVGLDMIHIVRSSTCIRSELVSS